MTPARRLEQALQRAQCGLCPCIALVVVSSPIHRQRGHMVDGCQHGHGDGVALARLDARHLVDQTIQVHVNEPFIVGTAGQNLDAVMQVVVLGQVFLFALLGISAGGAECLNQLELQLHHSVGIA